MNHAHPLVDRLGDATYMPDQSHAIHASHSMLGVAILLLVLLAFVAIPLVVIEVRGR